ncbi:MAG: PASTA domain-containing protein, partial [Vicinamibacteria bacterium]
LKLRADCSYSVGSTRTEPLEQSQCALKLILKFVSLLKELGRFDDSLIVVNGDHGGPYRTLDGKLVTLARSRSLDAVLLVKPVGTPAAGELQVSDLETSLLLIPGIVMSSVVDAESSDAHPEPWIRRRAIVPRVEEEMVESAKLILDRNGFSLGEVTRVHDPRYAEGTVLSQDPPAFSRGEATDQVSVVVSRGPSPEDPNVMPNFVGRNVTEVVDWLQKRQLPTTSIHHVAQSIAPEHMVVTQSPRAGDRLDEDAEVVFYVSRGN